MRNINVNVKDAETLLKPNSRTDTPQQQQYVPASEQQVPEPKKYTGSAIPSRSFKILQAMTTPENAGKWNKAINDEHTV